MASLTTCACLVVLLAALTQAALIQDDDFWSNHFSMLSEKMSMDVNRNIMSAKSKMVKQAVKKNTGECGTNLTEEYKEKLDAVSEELSTCMDQVHNAQDSEQSRSWYSLRMFKRKLALCKKAAQMKVNSYKSNFSNSISACSA